MRYQVLTHYVLEPNEQAEQGSTVYYPLAVDFHKLLRNESHEKPRYQRQKKYIAIKSIIPFQKKHRFVQIPPPTRPQKSRLRNIITCCDVVYSEVPNYELKLSLTHTVLKLLHF